MSGLRKWILYSTVAGAFCNRFLIVVGGVNLFYFYFVIAFNFALLAGMGYRWFPKRLGWFLTYLFASGLFGLLLGTNSTSGFFKAIMGISVFACYSATFMRFNRFDAVQVFRLYASFAYYSAWMGFLILPFQGYPKGRVTGTFMEPSGFAIVCVPAVFYYADQWQRNRRYGIRLLTLLAACVLTLSSVGYTGMMLGIFLFGLRYRFGRVFVPPLLIVVFALAWTFSPLFQLRMGDLFTGLSTGDVNHINESSFGVVANTFITEKQFVEHPVVGGGLGSHVVAHERFLDEVPGAWFLPENLRTLGQFDASSLMLRIISELGLVGVFGAFWFLWHYFPRGGTAEERATAMALLCYVLMKFCRSGEYFGAEQFLFFSIYTIVGVKAKLRIEAKRAALSAQTGTVSSKASHSIPRLSAPAFDQGGTQLPAKA